MNIQNKKNVKQSLFFKKKENYATSSNEDETGECRTSGSSYISKPIGQEFPADDADCLFYGKIFVKPKTAIIGVQ